MNIELSKRVLESIRQLGVEDILLCAGARNSPLVMVLEKSKGFRISSFFEERSAGFFALGRSQRDRKPVAVITTSGTAVAELLPAAVEATYTQTPLIFVTADRPRSYRGTGAPQSIDQVGIFTKYVETCLDIADPAEGLDFSSWSRVNPLQINVCFDEPLIDKEILPIDFSQIPLFPPMETKLIPLRKHVANQPLVIAGPMSVSEAEQIRPFLENLGAPIYAEGLSNLRGLQSLQKLFLHSGEKIVRDLFVKGKCLSVIRIGGVPTVRFWRDLEETFKQVPVISLSATEYTGLSRSAYHTIGYQYANLIKSEWSQDTRAEIFKTDQAKWESIQMLLKKYPRSEMSLISELSRKTSDQFVYLGNSLPIREWDLASIYENSAARQTGNRGANGIDGQISSFLGGASPRTENWAVIGDLTALYDLSALWITKQLEKMKLRLVIVNNQGGLIFKNMFEKEIFLNRHQIEFSKWAEMFHWDYQLWKEVPSTARLGDNVVIELQPDPEQSQQFWNEYKSL